MALSGHAFIDFHLLAGIPLQFTTDCGSKTTRLYGLQNALR
jgi:hypothetical protein